MSEIRRSPIRCVLIEPDEARRWMLSFLLQNSVVWQIVAECEALELGLVRLDALRSTPDAAELVLIGSTNLNLDQLVPIVVAIAAVATEAKIVVLGTLPASNSAARLLGADGYWWTGDRPDSLLELLQTLRPIELAMKPSRAVVSPAIAALGRLAGNGRVDGMLDGRFAFYDRKLAQLDIQLRTRRLTRPVRWFLQGRIREIQAARWIAQQLIPPQLMPQKKILKQLMPPRIQTNEIQRSARPVPPSSRSTSLSYGGGPNSSSGASLIRSSNSERRTATGIRTETALRGLFDRLILRLEAARISPISGLDNLGPIALEIDVLTPEMQVALLTAIVTVLQAEIGRLRAIGLEDLPDRIPALLETVWELVVIQFFRSEPELANSVRQASAVNASAVNALLARIPLVGDWAAYGLWGIPLSLDNQPYAAGTPQADDRALLLLENTVLRLANAVIQPLLNQFSDIESVKARYFKIQYASSRELTRFRNDLSWRYRRDRWIDRPTDIFESQYRLLYLAGNGIGETMIYAPRQQELAALSGLPLAVTLVLETRDAISPRLRAAIGLIGIGVIYVLTEVVGRGIGLVGQGIIKGIGNAWNDRR